MRALTRYAKEEKGVRGVLEYLKTEGIDTDKIIVNEDAQTRGIIAAEYLDVNKQVYLTIHCLDVVSLKETRFVEQVRHMADVWEKQDFVKYLMLLHRRYYSIFLLEVYSMLWTLEERGKTIEEWWEIFEYIWVDSEYITKYVDNRELLEMFEYNPYIEQQRETLKEKLNGRGKLEIYRGEGTKSTPYKRGGISWTLSREQAVWFANRYNSQGTVYRVEVGIDQVLAYITGRGEEEVIVNCEKERVVKIKGQS